MASNIPYLDVQNLSKSFGTNTLFHEISFSISEGQKVGLIAKNGTGKSTLLSILTGKESKDDGNIIYKKDLKVGMLEQTPHFNINDTVLDACFNHNGNEEQVLKAKQILTQLKIKDLNQPMRELSGGQQKRVALANILITNPDLLILDEPTNHLDLEMIVWLEGFLSRGNKTLLMVTHDRYFLDKVCNIILELDNSTIYSYKGNYAYFLDKREERINNTRAEIQHANNLYRRELEWMRRQPQARGHKAKYREDAFYELEAIAKQRIEERQVRLKSKNVYIGSKIFECQYVSKAWSEDKSTFIKMLLGEVKADSGKFDIGENVKFGYFSQEGLKFNENEKVIDVIKAIAEYVDLGGGKHLTASQLLQFFMFTPKQQHNFVYKLSGGEKRKLYLCTVLMRNPNFLVLDEPTNDLDIQTLQVLEEYLQDFPGCVIIVSHDRYFMDKIIDHLLVFEGQGKIKDFPGNYTQYREWLSLNPQSNNGSTNKDTKPTNTNKVNENVGRKKMTYKEKMEFEQLEKDIELLEAEQTAIETALCTGELSVEDITQKSKRLSELKSELDEKSFRWLELCEIGA